MSIRIRKSFRCAFLPSNSLMGLDAAQMQYRQIGDWILLKAADLTPPPTEPEDKPPEAVMPDDIATRLRSAGFLAENHSYAEVIGHPRKTYYPWCMYDPCPETYEARTRHRDVGRNAFECPYCQYALVWRPKKAGMIKGRERKEVQYNSGPGYKSYTRGEE